MIDIEGLIKRNFQVEKIYQKNTISSKNKNKMHKNIYLY